VDVEHQGHASHWKQLTAMGPPPAIDPGCSQEPYETHPLSHALIHPKHIMQAGEAGHACRKGKGAPVVTVYLPVWVESVVAGWI
jgi:hypothetical protein